MSSAAVTGNAALLPQTELELSIKGMTCAACAVRVEKKLSAVDGVAASVNFATGKAALTAPPSDSVAQLIEAVEQAGYGAEAKRPGAGVGVASPGVGADAVRVAYLRRRLIVALVFFVPLSDVSVLLSLFPAYRFPGWQWVRVALAAPVAGWAAWPFHQAALKNARHGLASMDTLVSLGIMAACGWSVYAMFVLDRGQGRVSPVQARARRDAGDAMRELAAAGAAEACLLVPDGAERRVEQAAEVA